MLEVFGETTARAIHDTRYNYWISDCPVFTMEERNMLQNFVDASSMSSSCLSNFNVNYSVLPNEDDDAQKITADLTRAVLPMCEAKTRAVNAIRRL